MSAQLFEMRQMNGEKTKQERKKISKSKKEKVKKANCRAIEKWHQIKMAIKKEEAKNTK